MKKFLVKGGIKDGIEISRKIKALVKASGKLKALVGASLLPTLDFLARP